MGLTERHWFENEDVPENYEWALEDAVYNSALQKEQEPIAPSVGGSNEPDGYGSWWYQCGKCKTPIDYKDKFCRSCGRAVKWDDR